MVRITQLFVLITGLCLMGIFFQGCPSVEDPDIRIYAEIDCMKGYKPTIKLAHKWISKVTKEDPGNRRGLYDKYDETSLIPQENINISELWALCSNHDNLSQNENWWVYVIGVKKIANDETWFGISKVIGSYNSPDDNSHSAVAISSIYRQCGQYDTEDEVIETVTAHEIFHQFWVNRLYYPNMHCNDPYCIMFWDVWESNPQVDLCGECQQLLKEGQP